MMQLDHSANVELVSEMYIADMVDAEHNRTDKRIVEPLFPEACNVTPI
jgi:hypothetical protein